jgi:hypothetical protein
MPPYRTVLELRIEFPPAKPFLPSTQAVLDAAALAFLEEFPGTTLYHRAPEECCIQLLLPSNQRPNALTSVQKEWCGLLEQEEGVTTECRGEYDPTKPLSIQLSRPPQRRTIRSFCLC